MKISIIIPTIGRETLTDVLEGIKACNGYEKLQPEILVIYNGCDSNKPEIPSTVRCVDCDEKVWAGQARNQGLDEATGDIVAFLGDDTVPEKHWLKKVHSFHTKNKDEKSVLLGMIDWVPRLQKDPFHKWLLNHAQFGFGGLKYGKPTWRHFYTSNISMKRSFVGDERFLDVFEGWGFEDSEFGYRFAQRGMNMTFDPSCMVHHDHEMTLDEVCKRTRSAAQNARRFEEIHPEAHVYPTPTKRALLQVIVWGLAPLNGIKRVNWWRAWKQAWVAG